MESVSLAYRFTGQRWDGVIRLYDYNARYYDPAIGRFIQPDTMVPEPGNPQSLNRYSYVNNNPVRYTDPSGHAICASDDCSVVFGPRQRNLIRRGAAAYYWDQDGLEMVWDWFTERGPQTRYYGASAAMTRDLMHDEGVEQAREQFYTKGDPFYTYHFTRPEQPIREAIQWATGEDKTGVGSVLGSYAVHIEDNGDGTITIWVHNIVSRESGTRLLGRGSSIEEMIATHTISKSAEEIAVQMWKYFLGEGSLQDVRKVWPKSILESTTRGQPSSSGIVPGVWGGDMEMWFMWTEPLCVKCR